MHGLRASAARAIALLVPVAVVGWAVTRSAGPTLRGLSVWSQVYSVAEVQRQLARNPMGWAGRIVLVRARAILDRTWTPPDSLVARTALGDPTPATNTAPLSLQWGRPDPLLSALRRLPLLGRLVPPPQRPHWDGLAVYRLQLCAPAGCDPTGADAVLLDADPSGT